MAADGDPSAPSDAVWAAALIAVDPKGLGGVQLVARAGPARDEWLARLRAFRPDAPWCRLPAQANDAALFGGLDLPATFAAGRPVVAPGLLARGHGGTVVVPMAERLPSAAAARLAAVLDSGTVASSNDSPQPATFALVLLDESVEEDERPPAALCERLGFAIRLPASPTTAAMPWSAAAIAAASGRVAMVTTTAADAEALCGAAVTLGIASVRVPLFALRAARAVAALRGVAAVEAADLALAARLVLAPRATQVPVPPDTADEAPAPEPDTPPPPTSDGEGDDAAGGDALHEIVLAAAAAAVPPDLLARLRLAAPRAQQGGAAGAGALRKGSMRGRRAGQRQTPPKPGARPSLVATLHAAAPWQMLRRRERVGEPPGSRRLEIRARDFRFDRVVERATATTIFVVDASGSAALNRLAEAKGAVELLLAECYVRRDEAALIAFRGTRADTLLAPTRSLTRAKRALADLPGGGGTPLAAGLDAAAELVVSVTRRGATPIVVMMSDGRANVARDGRGGRAEAQADAVAAARLLRTLGASAIVVDTAPRPSPPAQDLAAAMGALYLPLPRADAAGVTQALRQARPAARR